MHMHPGTGLEATATQRRLARAGVTRRETEVLAALTERLRNREIADRLHVSVRTVESHVAALLRKLGVADRVALAEIGRQLDQTARPGSALPAPLTSLVGRDGDVSQLLERLASSRLVTLTGPAGIGKTRLALQAGTAAAGQFPDGARLADLAPAAQDRVGETLARALGVVPGSGWPLRTMLCEAVAGLHCLLLVDNCEHVIAGAAELVAELLAAGPQLRVLATSREPLGVPGEATFPVPALPVPSPAEAIRAGPATRQRHAAYYLALATRADRGLRGPEQREWLSRLTAEQPNLDATAAHFLATGQTGQAWLLIARVARYWDITGQRREAQDWVGRVQAAGHPPASAAVVEALSAASVVIQPDDTRAAFGLAQQAIALSAGMDERVRAQAELAMGVSAVWAQPGQGVPALRRALALFGASRPWDCAVTMQSLAYASASLAEALDWSREAVALFRRVGDHLYASSSLFVMAERAMVAGRADDEVHGWLTESHALAVAAGSEGETLHPLIGFSWLAWLRGDHERGAAMLAECLPDLRRLGDRRCLGRALYLIGERAREEQQLARAQELLTGSVEAVAVAGQSLILILALESLAAVRAAQGWPRHAAELLGAAQAARDSPAHLRPSGPPDEELRRSLVTALGPGGFDAAYAAGGALPPAEALRLAPGRI